MDVRCERCKTQYVFDDDQVTASGLTVQCDTCGHLFKVTKKALVVTIAVKAEDLEAPPIPASAVAPRAAARTQVMYPVAPTPVAPPAPSPLPVRFETGPKDVDVDVDGDLDAGIAEPLARERRWGPGTLAVVALLAIGAAAAGYTLAPRLLGGRADPAPLTLEVEPPHAATPAPAPAAAPAPAIAVLASAPVSAPAPDVAPAPSPSPSTPAPAAPPAAVPAEPPPVMAPSASAAPAAQLLAPAAPAAPRGPKALLAQADRLRERGTVAEALDLYGRVVADDPENVAALTGRGLCYLDLSRYPPAVASFEAALRAAPTHPDALLGLAEAYRWQGRDADAIRYYEQYLSEHPDGEEAAVARNALTDLRR